MHFSASSQWSKICFGYQKIIFNRKKVLNFSQIESVRRRGGGPPPESGSLTVSSQFFFLMTSLRWGSQTTLNRDWLSSCKSNYSRKSDTSWLFDVYCCLSCNLNHIRKSDTVLGTEESCLALATGLWQDETVREILQLNKGFTNHNSQIQQRHIICVQG